MKVLVIASLALVAIVQAKPYLPGEDLYGRGPYPGRGYGGGSYGSGREYGHNGYDNGGYGYLDQGYGSRGFQGGHDIRHEENVYDERLHQHHVSDVNRGGMSSGGSGGHIHSGQGGYESGDSNYGRDYGYGGGYGY